MQILKNTNKSLINFQVVSGYNYFLLNSQVGPDKDFFKAFYFKKKPLLCFPCPQFLSSQIYKRSKFSPQHLKFFCQRG